MSVHEAPEPAFRAPWPAVAIPAAILVGYALQSWSGASDEIIARLGVSSASLAAGGWSGLVTALFVHVSWAHAGMNALGALAFGAPVARLFGTRPAGLAAFFGLYLGAGVLASLGFILTSPILTGSGAPVLLVGASGAVSGLMGAASRRLAPGPGGLAPFSSGPVVGMAIGWIVVNLLLAVFGLGAVAGPTPIAWQAHLVGYAVGLGAVGLLTRALGGPAQG